MATSAPATEQRSVDSGASWQRAELPIRLAGNWFRGLEVSPRGGLVVGGDGVMLSLDGQSFTEIGGQ